MLPYPTPVRWRSLTDAAEASTPPIDPSLWQRRRLAIVLGGAAIGVLLSLAGTYLLVRKYKDREP